MKVLLTGYSGTLGRSIARALTARAHQVRALVHRRGIDGGDRAARTEEIWGSLDDPGRFIDYTAGMDAVIHCAVDWRRDSVGQFRHRNVAAPLALFDAAVDSGARAFVNISSVMVYGLNWPRGQLVTEEAPLADADDVLDLYPAAKIGLEAALSARAAHRGTLVLTIRPGLLFSATLPPVAQVRRVAGRPLGLIPGTGRNHLPYIHVDDVADLTVRALEAGQGNVVYNATPGAHVPCRQFADAWAAAHDPRLKVLPVPATVFAGIVLGSYAAHRGRGKPAHRPNVGYGRRRATRDIRYSSELARRELGWSDIRTRAITDRLDRLRAACRFG